MSVEYNQLQKALEYYEFNIPIPEEGLINYLVKRGFGDDVFIVEGEKIPCFSYLVKEKNETLRKIMEDGKRESEIKVCESITKTGFNILMRYYGYGKVKIDETNVSDVLMVCVCYNELELVERCKEYLEKNMKITLIQEIFNKIPCGTVLNDLKIFFNDYMIIYGNKLLEDSLLMNNNIKILEYLLSIDSLVVKSDKYIVEQLNKFSDKIPTKRTIDDIVKSENNKLTELGKSIKYKRIYIDPKPTKDEEFNELFYLYCLSHEIKNKWLKNEEDYKTELKKFELDKFIPELLRNKVILILTNTVDLINDFNLKYDSIY